MKTWFIILVCIASLGADDRVRAVYDLTTADLGSFKLRLLGGIAKNSVHYEEAFKEFEVVVIIHGGAYRFFLKDPGDSEYRDDKALMAEYTSLHKRIAALHEHYGVTFKMCDVGRLKHKIEKSNVLDVVGYVPNATIGLIDQQQAGFAYIPIR